MNQENVKRWRKAGIPCKSKISPVAFDYESPRTRRVRGSSSNLAPLLFFPPQTILSCRAGEREGA